MDTSLTFTKSNIIRYNMSLSNQYVSVVGVTYASTMPRLWTDTIEEHRQAVREATLDATAGLIAEGGLRGVTMSRIAEATGIGRATLYKYFTDIDAILLDWHEREIGRHLEVLAKARDLAPEPSARLEAVLHAYAQIANQSRGHHDPELAAFLHRDEQVARAERQLRGIVRDLLAEAAVAGDVRSDIAPDELANYCLHALAAAGNLPSKSAVRRLVVITIAGVRPATLTDRSARPRR